MTKIRDLSKREYERKLRANGFETDYFMGYWRKGGISISELNCPGNRREKLAYILMRYALLSESELVSTRAENDNG